MSLDSHVQSYDEQYFAWYKAPTEDNSLIKEKKFKPPVGIVLFNTVAGVINLGMGIPDAYDLVLQEKSYYPVQYAGTAIELIVGVTLSLAAIGAALDYSALQRSSK